jgi:hypothetical protein
MSCYDIDGECDISLGLSCSSTGFDGSKKCSYEKLSYFKYLL